MNIISFFVDNS